MSIYTPALSALRAYSTQMAGTANNIANTLTPGYKAVRVHTAPQKGGGVSVAVSRDLTPGPSLPSGQASTEGSNVDLVRETVDLITTRRAYQMNAKVIRILDETTGSILDVIE